MITYKDLNSQRQKGYWGIVKKYEIDEGWAEDALNRKDIDYWNKYGFNIFFNEEFIKEVDEWREYVVRVGNTLYYQYLNKYGKKEAEKIRDEYYAVNCWDEDYIPPIDEKFTIDKNILEFDF